MNYRKDIEFPTRTKRKPNFLDLPLKARLDIYRILLVQKQPLTPLHHQPIREYLEVNVAQRALTRAGVRLLQTCKQILDEATNVLYRENSFALRPDDLADVSNFLNVIGRSNCSKMSALNVNFEYSQEKQWRGRWSCQPGVDNVYTRREDIMGLADGNTFLPDYPVAGQVSFLDLDTVQDTIPITQFENYDFDWDAMSLDDDFHDLRFDNLYDGYPQWKQEWAHACYHVDPPASLIRALESITQCYNLRRLDLWFPDPQRFALGYGCLQEDHMFLRHIWPLKGLSELTIHGIDELLLIETMTDRMDIPRVVAELNCSRARPFLHVEAGRPNLRANQSWRVLQSDRYTLSLELRKGDYVRQDLFSKLPAEVRNMLYGYLFPCWFDSFHGNSHYEWRDEVNHPFILIQNLSFGCLRSESDRKYLNGGTALLALNKRLNEEITTILYGQCIFSTTPPNGPNRSCCPQTDHGQWFYPDVGLLIKFLAHIGPKNRKLVRHLYIGLHSFVSFPKFSKTLRHISWSAQHTLSHHATFCSPLSTTTVSWKIPRLVTLIGDIHGLDSLVLRFSDGVKSDAPMGLDLHWEPQEEDDFSLYEPRGKHMLNANYYLNLFSELKNVKHLEIAGCLGMTDSELFARLVGAETIAVRRSEERSRMIHKSRALDEYPRDRMLVETQAKAWGWKADENSAYGCYRKRLTPDNITPAVARRYWAARGMEEDMVLMADYPEELDMCRQ